MEAAQKRNVLLCLATQKGYEVLRVAERYASNYRLWVCTFQETGVAESYGCRIRELAEQQGHLIVPLEDFRSRLGTIVHEMEIDSILCIGWRYLIPHTVIAALRRNVIVAHDSLLPKFRGFAPLPTAMIVGESETGLTYLRVGEGIDNGPILWQRRVPIDPTDTIASLTEKLLPLYAKGAEHYFQNQFRKETRQDEAEATYSIWRDTLDYQINWSLDAARIERTVRALGPPYLGAQTTFMQETIVIHRVTPQPDLPFAIRQPGKIWSVDGCGRPTVVCGKGLVRVDEATRGGQSVLPCRSLRTRFQ